MAENDEIVCHWGAPIARRYEATALFLLAVMAFVSAVWPPSLQHREGSEQKLTNARRAVKPFCSDISIGLDQQADQFNSRNCSISGIVKRGVSTE